MAVHYDVFNGDADGICALQQLRLAQPREAVRVTGVKRDIALLARVPAGRGDSLTVLDISLQRNRAALQALLECGATVDYFDHHFAGDPLSHPGLSLHLDPAPAVCTSVLVDRHLQGRLRRWAVVGAFGDNLAPVARELAQACGLDTDASEQLRALGEAINYNAYGETEADLWLPPARLYELVAPHADPLDFVASQPLARELMARQAQDLALACALQPLELQAGARVFALPDAPWARRVQGVFANALAREQPAYAHVVLTEAGGGALGVSVRAPLRRPSGAEQLCLAFAGGGGRAAAAGIDSLPREQLPMFLAAVALTFPAACA